MQNVEIKNENLLSHLRRHDIKVTQAPDDARKEYLIIKAPLTSAVALFSEIQKNGPAKFSDKENKDRMHRFAVSSENNEFAGGSAHKLAQDLDGAIDMKPFIAAQKKFEKTGIERRLAAILQIVAPRRARKNSEHDGEWSYDRQWDIAPFSSTTKKLGAARTVDIECHVGISCRVTAEEFNRYGAMAWSISNLIEKAGITTNINLVFESQNADENGNLFSRMDVSVKSSGQYMPAQRLACVFQTVFVRRNIFALMVIACELLGRTVAYNLGQPVQQAQPIAFKKGKLTLTPDVKRATSDEIEAAIIAAIMQKEQK